MLEHINKLQEQLTKVQQNLTEALHSASKPQPDNKNTKHYLVEAAGECMHLFYRIEATSEFTEIDEINASNKQEISEWFSDFPEGESKDKLTKLFNEEIIVHSHDDEPHATPENDDNELVISIGSLGISVDYKCYIDAMEYSTCEEELNVSHIDSKLASDVTKFLNSDTKLDDIMYRLLRNGKIKVTPQL